MRKKSLTFIHFGNDWFAENKTSSHHIAEQISKQHRVVYVECPGLRAPKANKRDLIKLLKKLLGGLRGPKKISDNLYLFTLLQVPLHRYAWIKRFNRKFTVWMIKMLCWRLKIQNPILCLTVPNLPHLMQKIPNSLSIYYCVDDYSAYPDVNETFLRETDIESAKNADLVFAVSEPLLKQKLLLNRNVLLNEHGVDFDHFNRVYKREVDLALEMNSLSSPVIGFFGLIENWIDLELLNHIAISKPNWQLVLIGRRAVPDCALFHLPNVHYYGQKSFDSLPSYSRGFDVAILPYKHNRQIEFCNPIKLREYLATGKPIVSIRFPEAEKFSDVIEIADDYQSFVDKITFALSQDTAAKAQLRVEKVKPLTWENKINALLQHVYEHLDITRT